MTFSISELALASFRITAFNSILGLGRVFASPFNSASATDDLTNWRNTFIVSIFSFAGGKKGKSLNAFSVSVLSILFMYNVYIMYNAYKRSLHHAKIIQLLIHDKPIMYKIDARAYWQLAYYQAEMKRDKQG